MNRVLVLLICISLLGCATPTKTKKGITPKEEYYLGRSVAAKILNKSPLYKSKFNKYLNLIGKHLSYHSKRPEIFKGYFFALIKNKKPVSLATPGGIILISTGLIKELQNEDQLAAALAHEIAHIALYHSLEFSSRSTWNKVSTRLSLATIAAQKDSDQLNAAIENYDSFITDYSSKLMKGNYKIELEFEADHETLKILEKAGYDQSEFLRFISDKKSRLENVKSVLKTAKTKGLLIRKKRFEKEKSTLKLWK